jgi:hypothetical protein
VAAARQAGGTGSQPYRAQLAAAAAGWLPLPAPPLARSRDGGGCNCTAYIDSQIDGSQGLGANLCRAATNSDGAVGMPAILLGGTHQRCESSMLYAESAPAILAAGAATRNLMCPAGILPISSCAMEYLEFMDECTTLAATIGTASYSALHASCLAMVSAQGPGDGDSGSAVLCPTDTLTCTGSTPDTCSTTCAPTQTVGQVASCASLGTVGSVAAQIQAAATAHKIMIFGRLQETSTSVALRRLHDTSACFAGQDMTAAQRAYLQCLYPHEQRLGVQAESFVFFDGTFFGNGWTLGVVPTNELERRYSAMNVARTCGAAAQPPPPPPGQADACIAPGSTHVDTTHAVVPHQCAALKAALPRGCSAPTDSGPWNNFLRCAFNANHWVQYRSGGQGGCGGPTLFSFCESAFPGDADAIRCCSNSRCPWSASLFGGGGGHPYCINDRYAVNICCSPCACWLSPNGVSPGGRGNMTIIENYQNRNYPVLVNSDGLPIAAPFRCGSVGLFGNRNVQTLASWQGHMGDCSHNPMAG